MRAANHTCTRAADRTALIWVKENAAVYLRRSSELARAGQNTLADGKKGVGWNGLMDLRGVRRPDLGGGGNRRGYCGEG
jgi:hypothetical protein